MYRLGLKWSLDMMIVV